MHTFENGQPVVCPSLSIRLMYAYHCRTTNGMYVVEKKIPLSLQRQARRWYNLSGCRQEFYHPRHGNPIGSRFNTPKVFPATKESLTALELLGYNLNIEAIEDELAEGWHLGTIVTEIPKVGFHGYEEIETDVMYRFINEDTIEFVGPNGEPYITDYKSLKV